MRPIALEHADALPAITLSNYKDGAELDTTDAFTLDVPLQETLRATHLLVIATNAVLFNRTAGDVAIDVGVGASDGTADMVIPAGVPMLFSTVGIDQVGFVALADTTKLSLSWYWA